MRALFLILALFAFCSISYSEDKASLPLMPWPKSIEILKGEAPLAITPGFTVAITKGNDARLQMVAGMFLNDLRRHTGMVALDFQITPQGQSGQLEIACDAASKELPQLGEDESYTLTIGSTKAELHAATTLGVMRGFQTFLQLVQITPQGFAAPAVKIEDKPQFPWRGLMIDSSRHFMPIEVIKRNLDGMAAVKLNVFHWHLSDNQGFRVESKKLPKLQEMGSDGLYYTQDQVKDVIAYARDRGIRVVPEFDIPGHCTAWLVGYPELGSGPGPFTIDRTWGVFDPAMDPTRESTYKFLDKFIGEMAKLFPDPFFHIGGDEVNGKAWDANPKIQDFMHAHGLKNNADLQAYFNTRVQKIVEKHGKTMEGWDEILRPDLPKNIVIQSWRGPQSLADAAKQGYRGLLSAGYYLDLNYTAASHYTPDPLGGAAASLSAEEKQRILGGEACMCAEYVSPENVDSRIWPRMAAIAERLWSPQSVNDIDSMYSRLDGIGAWLDAYGLKHHTQYNLMLKRMSGLEDASALRTLIDVVEPVKGYARYQLAAVKPGTTTPLNRAVDAARPESLRAREFSRMVDEFVSGKMRPGLEEQIRWSLKMWHDNDVALRGLAEKSSLVSEVAPISLKLAQISSAGLQALDYLDRSEKPPAGWSAQQVTLAQQAFQPQAQMLLMVAPPIQKLIQYSAGEKPSDMPLPKSAVD